MNPIFSQRLDALAVRLRKLDLLRVAGAGALAASILGAGCGRTGCALPPKANEPAPKLPTTFELRERAIFSIGTTMDIVGEDGASFGKVDERSTKLRHTFDYVDPCGQLIARASDRFFSWGTHIDVTDADGRPIGGLQEQVFNSLFKVYTRYEVLDSEGQSIAASEKLDGWTTEFTLRRKEKTAATLWRPAFVWTRPFTDTWQVHVADSEAIDSRVLVMIGAYKTSVDNSRSSESSSSEDSKSKSK